MKILILIALCCLSAQTFALDIGEESQAFCDSEQVRAQMGSKSSCRIVIGHRAAKENQGVCVGTFKSAMKCQVIYVVSDKVSGLQIKCGTDLASPVLDQTVGATAQDYSVAAVVTRDDKSKVVINKAGNHSLIEAGLVTVLSSSDEGRKEGRVILNLKTGPVELTDVQCQ